MTSPLPDHTDSPSTPWRNRRNAVILFVFSLVTGAASLMMSFHGLRDLVIRVEGVHGWLSSVGPVGIDGLQLASLYAIIITTAAPLRVRAYLWTVFFGSIGVSVAGNAIDAGARGISPAGMVLSGIWPGLLAAATHVFVMAVRWYPAAGNVDTADTAAPTRLTLVEDEPDIARRPSTRQLRAWARQGMPACRHRRKSPTRCGPRAGPCHRNKSNGGPPTCVRRRSAGRSPPTPDSPKLGVV